jgi:hypothetical protein
LGAVSLVSNLISLKILTPEQNHSVLNLTPDFMLKTRLFPLLAPILLIPIAVYADEKPLKNALPLRDVALFSSGVGYFGRSGQIEGETRVPLTVKAPQIADLLKSLVLIDPKGGVKPVTYSLQDYLAARPRETDLNLGAAASPGAILQAFQGAQVRLEKPSGTVEGRILSVNSRQIKVDDSLMTVEQLTILTALGVQSVRLDDVTSFRLLDPLLDAKLRSSLETRAAALTQKLDDGARELMLNFAGKGRREVSAGYLLETPAWKTSYRLVLDEKTKPYLQGWAVVENTTDEDWQNIRLSLISGRPISFIQDLATPVYVSRPIVPPQIIGSARPQTFGEGFSENEQKLVNAPVSRDEDASQNEREDARKKRSMALEGRPVAPPRLTISPSILHQSGAANYIDGLSSSLGRARTKIGAGLQYDNDLAPGASGEERGELFEYAIAGATSIARGEAAMVPIVSGDIGGDAVSIVESPLQQTGEIPASNGFLLRNSSGLHLHGGPITVFAGGIYAGDALVSNLAPKDARLIAYARDLELVALQNEPKTDGNVAKISVKDGILQIRSNSTKERSWNFKNKSGALKPVLLQVPDEAGWKLSDPKQMDEKTAGAQRFRFGIKPGDTVFKAQWETQSFQTVAIFDADLSTLDYYARLGAISPALKAKLAEISVQKRRLNDLAAQRVLQEKALKDIEEDQTRIRGNLNVLQSTSALYKQYERKLGAQEDRVEKVRGEIERLRAAENDGRTDLKNSLEKLDLE